MCRTAYQKENATHGRGSTIFRSIESALIDHMYPRIILPPKNVNNIYILSFIVSFLLSVNSVFDTLS